jgi:hypothetical protein
MDAEIGLENRDYHRLSQNTTIPVKAASSWLTYIAISTSADDQGIKEPLAGQHGRGKRPIPTVFTERE